jgi:D-inositol-3-phosphate glycosyltransferase
VIERVAFLSMHTSPLLQPGSDDAGGMNVYLHELGRTLVERGVDVTMFTRADEPELVGEVTSSAGYRVVHIAAGPERLVPVADLSAYVAEFGEGVVTWSYGAQPGFDLVHSHYWLSGWAGVLVKEALDIPLANSFHTLGRVKDRDRRSDEPASSYLRLLTEEEVIAQSDCVIASTPYEFNDLLVHYRAAPERLCISPPGVDHDVFSPGSSQEARTWLGLPDGPLILFVGRIQAHKGIDVAIRALPGVTDPRAALLVVGGPSGPNGKADYDDATSLCDELGVADRVHFVPPQPHTQLAGFYRAADVLIMPSRSESFGLVAAEAQACGLPVVAARVGGLPAVVADGESGVLIEGHDPGDFATVLSAVLGDSGFAGRLSAGAVDFASRFSWEATTDRFLELYAGITG